MLERRAQAVAAGSAPPTLVRAKSPLGWAVLIGGVIALLVANLSIGAFDIGAGTIVEVLLYKLGIIARGDFTIAEESVISVIRLPRTLMAAAVGAGLGISGAALQGLFRNPLAEPSLIGVSSGAAFAAALVLVLGLTGAFALPMGAFAGGLFVSLLIYAFARRGGRTQMATMLLAGIAINAALGAAISFLVFLADDAALRDITFWLLGSLSGSVWRLVVICAPLIVGASFVLMRYGAALNLLSLGDAEARHMGLRVERSQFVIVTAAALATGAGVAVAGIVGFVGLAAPHIVRLVVGPDHRRLLPASALAGAILVLGADMFARTVVAPAEMPVGIVTAVIGTPIFLLLIDRSRRRLEQPGW